MKKKYLLVFASLIALAGCDTNSTTVNTTTSSSSTLTTSDTTSVTTSSSSVTSSPSSVTSSPSSVTTSIDDGMPDLSDAALFGEYVVVEETLIFAFDSILLKMSACDATLPAAAPLCVDEIEYTASLTAKAINADSELTVWKEGLGSTKAGYYDPTRATTTHDPATSTNVVANGWRFVVASDSEGRISYLVRNTPNGYGGPSGQGYYRHPVYSSFETNPSFNFGTDYGPWTAQNPTASTKWELVVPQGGRIFSSHTSQPTLFADALAYFGTGYFALADTAFNVNSKDTILDNVRIREDEGLITFNYIANPTIIYREILSLYNNAVVENSAEDFILSKAYLDAFKRIVQVMNVADVKINPDLLSEFTAKLAEIYDGFNTSFAAESALLA